MRSMSACAPDQILKPEWRALRFIGSAERKLVNPECISPQIERQRARAGRSAGSSPASGLTSLRYCDRQGIPDPDAVMREARDEARGRQQQQLGPVRRVVNRYHLLDEFEAGHSAQEPAAKRPRGIILAADGENGLGHRRVPPLGT